MTDAFSAASAAASEGVKSAPEAVAAKVHMPTQAARDMSSPFAKSSELRSGGGGEWDPRVPFEDIAGRLVVMVPKSFDPEARDPFDPDGKKTRDEFRVDLVVLDGGKLEYEYADKDENDPNKKVFKTKTVEELPWTARSQTIAQGSLVGKLKDLCDIPPRGGEKVEFKTPPRLFLGVMAYAPFKAAERKGATIDSVTAEVNEWIAKGRKPQTKPDYTWALDDRPHVLTPEREALAGQWWESFRKTL